MLNRTGSTWLCAMLNNLPLGYKAGEWFNTRNKWSPFERETVDTSAHWRLLTQLPPEDHSRVVIKCNISQMRLFQDQVLADPEEHKYIFLVRGDLLAQALSQFLLQTRMGGGELGIECLDPVVVTELVAKYERANGLWARWLEENTNGHHRTVYEELAADPGPELRAVVEHLDGHQALAQIPADFDHPGARKKNQVPFIGQWREAMGRYAEGDDSWREVLEQVVEGELYLT